MPCGLVAPVVDRDHGVEAETMEVLHQLVGPVDRGLGPIRQLHRHLEGIALVGRAEDRASKVGDAPHTVVIESLDLAGIE